MIKYPIKEGFFLCLMIHNNWNKLFSSLSFSFRLNQALNPQGKTQGMVWFLKDNNIKSLN